MLSRWCSAEESACWRRRHRFHPCVGKIPWKREQLPTPVFLPGEFHGQRGKESDTTEWGARSLSQLRHILSRSSWRAALSHCCGRTTREDRGVVENFTEDQAIELDSKNRRDGRRWKGELMTAAAVAHPEWRRGGEKAQQRFWKGERVSVTGVWRAGAEADSKEPDPGLEAAGQAWRPGQQIRLPGRKQKLESPRRWVNQILSTTLTGLDPPRVLKLVRIIIKCPWLLLDLRNFWCYMYSAYTIS